MRNRIIPILMALLLAPATLARANEALIRNNSAQPWKLVHHARKAPSQAGPGTDTVVPAAAASSSSSAAVAPANPFAGLSTPLAESVLIAPGQTQAYTLAQGAGYEETWLLVDSTGRHDCALIFTSTATPSGGLATLVQVKPDFGEEENVPKVVRQVSAQAVEIGGVRFLSDDETLVTANRHVTYGDPVASAHRKLVFPPGKH